MKKFLISILGILCLGIPAANAQLEYKQVGTIKYDDYSFRTSSYPYSMSKYSETLLLYKSDILGLNADILLKEISLLGYQTSEGKTNVNFTIWLANTEEQTDACLKALVIPNPDKSNQTIIDTSKLTKFAEVSYPTMPLAGSTTQEAEVVKFESTEGFTYSGHNLIVYIELNGGKVAADKVTAPYTTFFTCNNGMTGKLIGGYRDSAYDNEQYNGGYGVNVKTFSWNESNTYKLPVLKIGYEGAKVQVSATINGRIVSSRNNAGIADATVKLNDLTATTSANGRFSLTVDDVDINATYTLTAEAAGFETSSSVIDIKAGGTIDLQDIVLTKLPVPAVLSGKVINSSNDQAVEGATLSFESLSAVSGADGSYSFDIANIDDLPAGGVTLSAKAQGFLDYSTTLSVDGDMNFDVRLEPLPELSGDGTQVGIWSPDDYSYDVPFNPLWKFSEGQSIYSREMLADIETGKKFSSLALYGYYTDPSATTPGGDDGGDDDDDWGYGYEAPQKAAADADRTFIVKAWLVNTELTGFDPAAIEAISTEGLTPNFEGEITLSPMGDASHPRELARLELTEPFVYDGKGMALIMSSTAKAGSCLLYFCTEGANNAAIGSYGSTAESVQKWTIAKGGVPVIKLGDFVPTGILSGKVTKKVDNGSEPLANVAVTLSGNGETFNTTTDEEGLYSFSVRDIALDAPYRVNFSLENYFDETKEVTFTEENLEQTLDVELEWSAIDSIEADSVKDAKVYSVSGVLMLENATKADIDRLPAGIYISAGRKVIVK